MPLFQPPFLAQAKPRPSGGGGGPPATNLVQHLKADVALGLSNNDPVSTWTASVGKNATGSGSNRPLFIASGQNSLPVIRFDGIDDFLATADFDSAISQPFVVFLAFKINTLGTNQFVFDTVHVNGNRSLLYKDDANAWRPYAGSFVDSIGATANTSFHLLSLEFNGASSKYRFDNGSETAMAQNPGTNGIDSLYLGMANDGVSNPAAVDLGEMMVYSGTIADKSTHFTYLNRFAAF